ncbi:hypothetical protein ACEQ8H_002735 [Pleosporales sp. CAS-2024a]
MAMDKPTYSLDKHEPHAAADEVSEGQAISLESRRLSLWRRFDNFIRLDQSEVQSVHGKWSNVGMRNSFQFHEPRQVTHILPLQTWTRFPQRSRLGDRITVSMLLSPHSIDSDPNPVVTYWLCDAVAPGNLRLGSSIMTLDFSWRETIGIIFLGHFLKSLAITANAIIGAKYHIPYTFKVARALAFSPLGFFWYGINTYNGALCVNAVILAIWPSFRHVPNGLPKSANITTQIMTAYVIYFLITLPFHYIHPRYLKWFFDIKTISMLGNYGTMAVNINDFARYARSTKMVYAQILAVPLSFMLMAFMGIIIAGAASDLYHTTIWDPLTIMSHWEGSSGARAGAAFVSLSFVLAQLGANISANCISASNDLNAMFPSYVNLRRGSYIIAFVGAWALTPWNILASASALLNFMDGYIIWLAPITGILLADYYVVHRRNTI